MWTGEITLYSLCSIDLPKLFLRSPRSFLQLISIYTTLLSMQAGNGTAPATGAPGAGGGRPTLDQIIFMGLQSNPGKMTVRSLSIYAQSPKLIYNSPGPHWVLRSLDLRRERSFSILEGTTNSSTIGIPSGSRWVWLRVAWLLGESIVSSIWFAKTDMSSAQFAICVAQVGDLHTLI